MSRSTVAYSPRGRCQSVPKVRICPLNSRAPIANRQIDPSDWAESNDRSGYLGPDECGLLACPTLVGYSGEPDPIQQLQAGLVTGVNEEGVLGRCCRPGGLSVEQFRFT
jgi:hypothetical protein